MQGNPSTERPRNPQPMSTSVSATCQGHPLYGMLQDTTVPAPQSFQPPCQGTPCVSTPEHSSLHLSQFQSPQQGIPCAAHPKTSLLIPTSCTHSFNCPPRAPSTWRALGNAPAHAHFSYSYLAKMPLHVAQGTPWPAPCLSSSSSCPIRALSMQQALGHPGFQPFQLQLPCQGAVCAENPVIALAHTHFSFSCSTKAPSAQSSRTHWIACISTLAVLPECPLHKEP